MANATAEIKQVRTPKGRVSFPSVFQKSGMDGAEPKYRVTLIFGKDQDLSELKALATKAAREKWGDKIPANFRSPFRDGATRKRDDGSFLEGYDETKISITATSTRKPGVVGADPKVELHDEEDVYGGCFGRATVTAFAYDKGGNRGVGFGLQNFQKLAEGPAFGGKRSKPTDDFDAVTPEGAAAPVAGAADPLFG